MNGTINRKTTFLDIGVKDYKEAWDFQASLFDKIVNLKIENRKASPENQRPTDNFVILCEHPHVFTLGKTGNQNNLLLKQENFNQVNASFYHINRGGDITYHGPGQLVVYPILDLENFFTDIHRYMRMLEEAVIETLKTFGVEAGRIPGLTGVWLDADSKARARKICALGVKTSRWVTMHGLALNVNTDLRYFDYIIPCGISDKAVTSLQKELGMMLDMNAIKTTLKEKITGLFEMEPI